MKAMRPYLVGAICGVISYLCIKLIPKGYLPILLCLFFVYCLYSLTAFLQMPKNFKNTYSRIYKKQVKYFLSAIILYALCWLFWSANLRGLFSSIASIAVPLVSLILGLIASVFLFLFIVEGGYLTLLLPFVILKKYNREVAITSTEEKWKMFTEYRPRQQKLIAIFTIIIVICLSVPIITIAIVLFFSLCRRF